ncbi:MAG: T9SS type A sorting domain-containing protein [candidate division Zixibacteria bacterium]|nr:T9SS type A sorting domain-containing protein [Candidatus Tariuqbacter arcticus]
MRKRLLLFIIVLTFAFQASIADWVELNTADDPYTVRMIETNIERTVLNYAVNGYAVQKIIINGESYTLMQKLRKESIIEEKGFPRLPRINRSIIIPDDGVMGFRVISAEYIEVADIDIAPSKGNFSRTIDPATVPYTFADVYREDAFFPAELVNIREPYILHDYRGVVVELNAFRYNPVTRTLRIYTDITVEVKKTAPGGKNTIIRDEPLTKLDPLFHKTYHRRFINYPGLDYPTLFESGEMLVICYDDFMDEMDPFVEWKNQKGLPTTIVPVSEAGSNTTAIKDYIRSYYYQNDLCYVLLVGDNPQIPTFTSGSDPVYSLLAGGDDYPDIFIGRFSAETRSQVETQVERTITYEKYPDPNGDWYHMGLGDADESGPTNHEDYDFQHITRIAEKLVHWNYTQVDSVYTTFGGTTQMIVDFMDAGVSIFNYAGHGWINMVGPVNFTSTNANQLVNDNMLFHFVAIACQPGNFVNHTCLAEDLLRATNNITGEPTGAIAVYLSKISQSWFPPYDMQDEGIDLIVSDSMLTFGGMCFNGSMLMIDLHGAGGISEFKAWTIFGDPSVLLRSDTPYELVVNSLPMLFIGLSTYDVAVLSGGNPLEGALVCGMNDEIYAAGYTNSLGQVTLDFGNSANIPGNFILTVTAPNAIPYIDEIDIIPTSGPYVVYDSHTIDDDIIGNNNGQLDYSEAAQLGMTLNNVGVEIANTVSAVIASEDTLITISQDSAYFGDIPAGETVTVNYAFDLELSSSVEDGHLIVFTVTAGDGIEEWESNFYILAHAPEVFFSSLIIDDAAGGNGNGNLDPGETADLLVTLINDGSTGVDDIEAVLSLAEPYITVTSANAVYGTISVGDEVEASFSVEVAPDCPQEYTVDFDLDITGSLGYANITGFSTIVGDITYMPSGPDNYGYLAYDIHDAPEFPVYDWVEICPDSGGLGTLVPFVNNSQVLHYALPFTFRYYGIEYDTVTIATNGWLGMGVITEEDYSNSGIPDPDGPAGMIASYWENLSPQRTNSGGVWYWYDEVEHRYIVEFNHVEQHSPTGNFETFQTILYDSAYYPTFTGDGRIKAQYKDMSIASQEEGTIGIESPDETDGIQYFFDGAYDLHATPIDDGMAILFTTPLTAPEVVITLTPAVTPIVIPGMGGSFDYNLNIENMGTGIVVFDAWLDVLLPDTTLFGPLLLREGMTLGPSGSLIRDMTQSVPGNAPPGDYIYYGKVGNYPDVIFDSDSFPFTKAPWDGSNSIYSDWLLNGWDDEITLGLSDTPREYYLAQNAPNPFNPTTAISYQLPAASYLKLVVYDVTGREVSTLVDGWVEAGIHQVSFNASQLASGVYFYRLIAGDFQETKKMILTK